MAFAVEPAITKFAYKNFKILEKCNKWTATCRHCKVAITEVRDRRSVWDSEAGETRRVEHLQHPHHNRCSALPHQSLVCLKCSNTPNVNGDVAVSYLAHLPLRAFHLPNRLTTTDEAIRHITGMKLTELDLTNYIYVTDISMPYIGQLTQLVVLRLSNTKITDNGLMHLQGLANLEELNLDRTATGNAGMTIIRGLSELRELSLSSTGVTNGFLRSGVLNSCLELTKLNLNRNTISNQGITCLRLPSLSLLNIDETFVRPEIIETVRTNCPSLEKFTYQTLNAPPRDESDFD